MYVIEKWLKINYILIYLYISIEKIILKMDSYIILKKNLIYFIGIYIFRCVLFFYVFF